MGSRLGITNFHPFILPLLALTFTYPCFSSSKSNTHLCLPNQRDALLQFRNAYNITTWNEHVDCCLWSGISCDNITGDVIGIDMSRSYLTGTINNIVYLSSLYNLQRLDLSYNYLHGAIPTELSRFSKLTSLFLITSNNQVTMESYSLKLLVQNLTQIEYLDLSGVEVYGDSSNALVNVSTTLKGLYLSDCDLKGVFPNSIFHRPKLLYLDLQENIGLMVSLPIFNWSSPLMYLSLSSTNFSGKLPDSIGNLKNLGKLYLSSCHISNSMPSSIGNLTRLFELKLSSFALEHTIPYSICRLSDLEILYLPSNKFNGMIPQCLGNLTRLWLLDLSSNQFITGPMPQSLAFITHLEYLNVSSNMITDTIPYWLQSLSALSVLDLGANNFHGNIPLSICELDLSCIDISNNRLVGTIPTCLFDLRPLILNLRMNNLEGTIIDAFPQHCSIVELDLSENQLKDPLPRSLVHCKDLKVLDLSHNNIEDFFPNWLETLPKLQILGLGFNKLHGEVKTLLNHQPFPNLKIFDISNNNLSGQLPTEYITQCNAMKDTNVSKGSSMYLGLQQGWMGYVYSYSTTLIIKGCILIMPKVVNDMKLIDFSNNNFHGTIPEIIGDLIALKGLNLSHNKLTGNIPPSVENMKSLEWLDLSSNKLTGRIPSGLTRLTLLSSLNLSQNELSGMIPQGNQFNTFGMDSFVGNAELCGSQIAIACGNTELCGSQIAIACGKVPFPSSQEDEFDVFNWKMILMGYGCGLVIGFSIGYIVFELRRPEWFVSLVEEKLLKKIVRPKRRADRLLRA